MHKLLVIVLMSVFACGDNTTTIDGSSIPRQIDIVHRIDIENIKAELTNECTQLYETQEEIDQCVSEKVNELIDFLSGLESDSSTGTE